MDGLVGFLNGPRARGAFLLRTILEPPWSLRIEDEAPLTLMAAIRGEAWIVPANAEPRCLRPGDIAIARGPDPYLIADDPHRPAKVVIHPGQQCTTLSGIELAESMSLGVRTWGDGLDGSTMLLIGTYEKAGEISRQLLDALPPLVVLTSDVWDSPLVTLLAEEIAKDRPGQEAVLDRLLDLVLVDALRTWFSARGAEAPTWYQAQADPIVGRALRLLHNNPAHPWTVASLASETGVSRAALARRFRDVVGEPPMAFLTNVRLTLAADLLQESGATVGAVAQQVGYGTPFALSAAFKRVRGISPQDYRLAAAAAAR
jgi:AraC-like DNA-binding protein